MRKLPSRFAAASAIAFLLASSAVPAGAHGLRRHHGAARHRHAFRSRAPVYAPPGYVDAGLFGLADPQGTGLLGGGGVLGTGVANGQGLLGIGFFGL